MMKVSRRIGAAMLVVGGCAVAASGQTNSPRSVLAQRGSGASFRAGVSTVRTAGDAAPALLNKRVESISWDEDTTFEEVIDWLRAESDGKVNVLPRWTALGIEGIDRDTVVTLDLTNTTVAEVLNETIDQISDDGEIRYHAFGNKLKISTKADFDRRHYLRIYDAADIVFRVEDFGQGAPAIDLQQAGQGGGGGGGGGASQSVFTGAGGAQSQSQGGEQAEQELEERLEKLKDVIVVMFAPETWADTGGGGRGQIRVYNSMLIVKNTIEVHQMIAGYFAFE